MGSVLVESKRFAGLKKAFTYVAIIIALIILAYVGVIFLSRLIPALSSYIWIIKVLLELAAGLFVVRSIGNGLIEGLRKKYEEKALSIGNLFKVVGYITVISIIAIYSKISSSFALLGGTVTGLILGFAFQPILQNLFAGLLFLGTGFIKPGDVIRIINWQVGYTFISFPAYKFFSPDFAVQGYKGRVVEVGLFSTVVLMENGSRLKVPNQIVLGGAVVEYRKKVNIDEFTEFAEKLRIEIPIDDMEVFEMHAREVLSKIGKEAKIYLSEQSDKNYVIYIIQFTLNIGDNWFEIKDKVLRELLSYKRKIKT